MLQASAQHNTALPMPDPERRRMILHLARNVASARHRAGWTQHQLARAADLSRATIHLIEAGACDPRLSTVTSLAKALGMKPIALFDEPAIVRMDAR